MYDTASEALQSGRATNPLISCQGFRLEDVDWNSIAQRYPNLFSSLSFHSDQK